MRKLKLFMFIYNHNDIDLKIIMSYTELITALDDKSNKILNLNLILDSCLESSEEFGHMMEDLYDEPMEYDTSKCESLHKSLQDIFDIIVKYDTTHIDTLILSNKFNINLNEMSRCESLLTLYQKIRNSFSGVKIINFV